MKTREVLIIGAGIAGCAVALSLAKKGIPVTILTSSFDQHAYHASFIPLEKFEERVHEMQQQPAYQFGCSRASEQFVQTAKKSVEELLGSNYLIDKRGNIEIHRCLQEQLQEFPHVEWILHHTAIELLTLENHSIKQADIYKKATCLGAYVYNHETRQIEKMLAKETILATGGATYLYPYTTHAPSAKGDGFALAYRAGARLLHLDKIQFYPLALVEKHKPGFPLPLKLIQAGRLQAHKNYIIEELDLSSSFLAECLYQELVTHQQDQLWLDLTMLDPIHLKDHFSLVDAYCLAHGFNIAKDVLPVAPVAQYTCGGISVERTGQTTISRLRAIGEVASSGLIYNFNDEALGVLESLTWATACGDDISKYISKFIYYFPETREWDRLVENIPVGPEDWQTLRHLMWHYVGIVRQPERLKKGYQMLKQLYACAKENQQESFSIEQHTYLNALQTSLLIVQSALEAQDRQPKILDGIVCAVN